MNTDDIWFYKLSSHCCSVHLLSAGAVFLGRTVPSVSGDNFEWSSRRMKKPREQGTQMPNVRQALQ